MANDLIIELPKFANQVSISGEWLDKRDSLMERIADIGRIQTELDFKIGGDLLQQITKHSNTLEKMRKDLTDPFMDAQKSIKRKSDEARFALEEQKTYLQKNIAQYIENERKRVEQQKREAEEKQRAAIEAQLLEQEELKAAGLVEEEAPFVPEVVAVAPVVEQPKSFDIKVMEVIEWEIYDETKVPSNFRLVDERLINLYKRENKERIKSVLEKTPEAGRDFIPGILFKKSIKPIGR